MLSSLIRGLIFGCSLGLMGEGLAWLVHAHGGLNALDESIMLNVLTGIVAGGLVFIYLEERRRRTTNRMEEIAFLNHHIRNALTAINLSSYAEDDSMRLKIVADASQRIETTLREMSQQEHVSLNPSAPFET
jgi:hypothetical protein